MFDQKHSVMWAFAKKKTQWKEYLFFAVKLARQKLSKYHAEVTPTTGMLLISAQILDPFPKLQLCRKWDKGMDINHEDEISYSTQYQEAFLRYVENEYCAKHRHVQVNTHESSPSSYLIPCATALGSWQSSFDPYDMSSNDEEYLPPNNVAETTPRRSDRAAPSLTATRLYLNLPPEAPKDWGRGNPNLNDYHPDPMEISSTLGLPHITDWWSEREQTRAMSADLSNVARDIFSITPHVIGVEASFSLGRDDIGWKQSETTDETLREKVVGRQFAGPNNGILAGADPDLDKTNTEKDSEMTKESEERKSHRLAKVCHVVEMRQGWQNPHATQKGSCAQNTMTTDMAYISDTEEIIKALWSLFQHEGPAAFISSEWSLLSPSLSAKDHPGERSQIFNVRGIRRRNRYSVESDENCAPQSISDKED